MIAAAEKFPDHDDIGLLNLKYAEGLPGSEGLSTYRLVSQMNDWASLVRLGTRNKWHTFQRRPQDYDDSEAVFRMLIMMTVLCRNLGMKYAPHLIPSVEAYTRIHRIGGRDARPGDLELALADGYEDSRNLFIHGILQGHGGTCTSMPVLTVAIGHRLGYPLKLMGAPGHYFVRWDDGTERFNIEATSGGLSIVSDEHVLNTPISRPGDQLVELTPDQVHASFLKTRADCFIQNIRYQEALDCYDLALELDPDNVKMHETRMKVARYNTCFMLLDNPDPPRRCLELHPNHATLWTY